MSSVGFLVIIIIPLIVVFLMFLCLYAKYRFHKETQDQEVDRVQVLQRRRQQQAQLVLLSDTLSGSVTANHTGTGNNRGEFNEAALLKFFDYDTIGKQEKKSKMILPTAHSSRFDRMRLFHSKPRIVAVPQDGAIATRDDEGCSICLEGYKDGEVICTPKTGECNHIFHKKCLFGWVEKNHSECPLCRAVLITTS